jgi:choline dehydrogenase-like flavoprotein
MRDAYEYIIVGAGSAGCVLASRLSENPAVEVLLLESGPDDNNPLITMPLGVGKLLSGARKSNSGKSYIWFYSISPGGNRPPEFWLKGRTLGGSSSINGMVYVRGRPSDYDHWEALGCRGWGWQTIGRCFREMERHQLGSNAWRGADGPLHITLSRLNALGKSTIAAAREAGTPSVSDINDIDAVTRGGVGPQPCTIWRGQRVSASRAFLAPVRHRRNLHIATETDVLGIEFDGLTATGVRTQSKSGVRTIKARREVILSAGAIHSPKLLQLAGIGPANLLKQHGIDVRVDSPNVGKNLQEHRTFTVGYRLKRGARNGELRGLGLVLSALNYAVLRRGALTKCIWEVGGFVKSLPDLAEPDCQIGACFYTYDQSGVLKQPGMAIYGYVLSPRSRGELSIASADPSSPPNITANFLTDPYDRKHTVLLFRYIRKLAQQPALAAFVDAEDVPGAAVTEEDELVGATFKQGACGMHVSGTCRMGADDAAVLDPDLRVRGVNRLRVVDTSIMPRLVSGNTNGPAMALAWHAAERIKQGI